MVTDDCLDGAKAAADYLDTLIRIADKYEIDRRDYVHRSVEILIMAAAAINYKEYRFERGEQSNGKS